MGRGLPAAATAATAAAATMLLGRGLAAGRSGAGFVGSGGKPSALGFVGGGFASAIPSPRGSLLGAVPTTRCKQRGRRCVRCAQENPFRVLDLPPTASEAEVKGAFRAAAKKYHPDVPGTGDEARFMAAREAADTLSTAAGRSQWASRMNGQRSNRAQSQGPRGGQAPRAHSYDAGDAVRDAYASGAYGASEAYGAPGQARSSRRAERRSSSRREPPPPWEAAGDEDERWDHWEDYVQSGRQEARRSARGKKREAQDTSAYDSNLWTDALTRTAQEAAARRKFYEKDVRQQIRRSLDDVAKRKKDQLWKWTGRIKDMHKEARRLSDLMNSDWSRRLRQSKEENDKVKEQDAKKWVEKFRLAQEEADLRKEEIGRKWSEKIRAAKEEGRRRKEAQELERRALERRLLDEVHQWKEQGERRARQDMDRIGNQLRGVQLEEQDLWEMSFRDTAAKVKRWGSKESDKWSRSFRSAVDESKRTATSDTQKWAAEFKRAAQQAADRAEEEVRQKQTEFWQSRARMNSRQAARQTEWAEKLRRQEVNARRYAEFDERKWVKKFRISQEQSREAVEAEEKRWLELYLEAVKDANDVNAP